MNILVTYATKHGATQGIAEFIAGGLRDTGLAVDVLPVKAAQNLDRYDGFVIGSAVYFDSWKKEATEFVKRNADLLAARPVWLFSSGPLGVDTVGADGNDLREVGQPKQVAELMELIHPRDHRVFFGALDRSTFDFTERLMSALPASRELFTEGDFRNWDDMSGWTNEIVQSLSRDAAVAG